MGKLPIRSFVNSSLKVANCEIFDRSVFRDFYTIKSLWGRGGGHLLGKIIFFLYMGSFRDRKIPYAYAQSNFKDDFFGQTKICAAFETND